MSEEVYQQNGQVNNDFAGSGLVQQNNPSPISSAENVGFNPNRVDPTTGAAPMFAGQQVSRTLYGKDSGSSPGIQAAAPGTQPLVQHAGSVRVIPKNEDGGVGKMYKYISGTNTGRRETVKHTEQQGEKYYFLFESGNRMLTSEVMQQMREVDVMKEHKVDGLRFDDEPDPLNIRPTQYNQDHGASAPVAPDILPVRTQFESALPEGFERVGSSAPQQQAKMNQAVVPVVDANDPVLQLLNKMKKVNREVHLELALPIPSKELYNMIYDSFEDGGDAVIEYLFQGSHLETFKEQMKDALYFFYNGEERPVEEVVVEEEVVEEEDITKAKDISKKINLALSFDTNLPEKSDSWKTKGQPKSRSFWK